MPSANYALMTNFISETWDRFPIFHAMLLGNTKELETGMQSTLIFSCTPTPAPLRIYQLPIHS